MRTFDLAPLGARTAARLIFPAPASKAARTQGDHAHLLAPLGPPLRAVLRTGYLTSFGSIEHFGQSKLQGYN